MIQVSATSPHAITTARAKVHSSAWGAKKKSRRREVRPREAEADAGASRIGSRCSITRRIDSRDGTSRGNRSVSATIRSISRSCRRKAGSSWSADCAGQCGRGGDPRAGRGSGGSRARSAARRACRACAASRRSTSRNRSAKRGQPCPRADQHDRYRQRRVRPLCRSPGR